MLSNFKNMFAHFYRISPTYIGLGPMLKNLPLANIVNKYMVNKPKLSSYEQFYLV